MSVVSIAEAARRIGRSRRTVERWLAHGAPHVVVRGRRHVDVDALRAWRDGDDGLRALARAIDWAHSRDAGHGVPAWRELGLPEAETLALLMLVYDRVAHDLGDDSGELPPELRRTMSRLLLLRRDRDRRR